MACIDATSRNARCRSTNAAVGQTRAPDGAPGNAWPGLAPSSQKVAHGGRPEEPKEAMKMDSLLETVGWLVLYRPVHALALGVFSYHAAATLLREWRPTRRSASPGETRAARPVPSRRLAA
jgi:hypothetical protein